MLQSNRSLRAALLASAGGLALTGAAYAQDNTAETGIPSDSEDTDTIVVTGIRRSIEDSLEVKKNNSSIVEAISAEDIGKLPDVSIADSLARLPGVTAQRVRGRSQQISIRGLGPDFSIALLNGREQVSAGNNRGIEFDQYPSELIAQGLVYKTPDATLAATGIAGAVDLRTVRPLDYSERQLNASARYVWNDQDQLNPDFSEDGYRFFGSYIDQNADGTVGWSIGVTVQSNPTQYVSRELKTNQFQVATDEATGLIYPSDNPRFGVVSRDFERTSIAGALQFEPTDRFQATFDAFYTDTEDAGIFRGVETPIASWSGASFESADGDGPFADNARYSGVVPILRTDTEGNTAEIFSIGLNTSYDVSERLTLTLDAARSELDRNDIDYESYAGTGPARSGAQDTFQFGFDDDGEFAVDTVLDYTDPANVLLTDPGGWGQVGFIKEPQIDDELNQIRLEADYAVELGPIASVKLGYLRTDREKNFDSNEAFLRVSDAFIDVVDDGDSDGNDFGLPIPSGSIVGATDSGSLGLDILAYDPTNYLTDGTYRVEKATFDTEWSVEEEVDTLYAMAEIDYLLGTVPVRGNFGFQYVFTEQASTGTLGSSVDATLQTVEEDYEDFLPSLNLTFEPQEDLLIRVAAAKTITRARLDQLAANQSIGFNSQSCADTDSDQIPDTVIDFDPPQTVCFSIGGGNPLLRPYESKQFDLSVEKYFTPASAIAVAFFHKDLSDWVQGTTVFLDGSREIVGGGYGDFLAANPQLALTQRNQPQNVADGSITGVEVTGRVFFGDFVEALDGFGASASYTYADSELTLDNNDITIPGYSEEVWSGDVYYEKYGWRARLNARYRGDFLSEVQAFDGSLFGAQAKGETILDAQLGYQIGGGRLDGFQILFEAYNITNEPFVTENDLLRDGDVVGTFPSRYEEYGRTYNITLSKEF